jgi:hypothetical protein
MALAPAGIAILGLLTLIMIPASAQNQPTGAGPELEVRTVGRTIADVLREDVDFSSFRMLVASAGLGELF